MSNRLFGWDLPPGLSHAALYDYLDGEEPPPMHCPTCGRFLPKQPFRMVNTVTREWCDGKVRVYYDEYQGKEIEVGKFVTCKEEWGDYEEHEPHWFEQPYADIMTEYQYKCSNGHITKVYE